MMVPSHTSQLPVPATCSSNLIAQTMFCCRHRSPYCHMHAPHAEELPSLEEAWDIKEAEQQQLGHNPRGGLASKALVCSLSIARSVERSVWN